MTDSKTRNRILRSAGPVFAEKGFQAATVREICELAEVNVASVNYHFGDKEQLYIEAVQHASHLRAQHAPLPAWDTETPPELKLYGFVHTLLSRMIEDAETPWQTRLMLREVLNPTSACQQLVSEYFKPLMDVLLQIIHELVPESTTKQARHQQAYSVIGQCLYYRVAGQVISMIESKTDMRKHFQIEALARHIASFSLGAMKSTSTDFDISKFRPPVHSLASDEV